MTKLFININLVIKAQGQFVSSPLVYILSMVMFFWNFKGQAMRRQKYIVWRTSQLVVIYSGLVAKCKIDVINLHR